MIINLLVNIVDDIIIELILSKSILYLINIKNFHFYFITCIFILFKIMIYINKYQGPYKFKNKYNDNEIKEIINLANYSFFTQLNEKIEYNFNHFCSAMNKCFSKIYKENDKLNNLLSNKCILLFNNN